MSEAGYPTGPFGSLIASQTGGGTPSRQNPALWTGPIPWASVKDFAEGGTELLTTEERISQQGLQASATNLIPANTPIVCTRMAVGRVAIAPMDVAINQDLKALTPARGVSTRYLLRLADYAKPKAEAVSVGSTVKGIKVSDYLNIRLPVAPLSAQPKIAEVLDTLDAAIRGTEAVVAKLRAMKQGLLHDLLTRGIDTNGDLRPPQPEAPHLYHQTPLGWLPKEWEVRLLDDAAQRGSGHTPSKSVASYWNGGIKWVSLADSHRLDQVYIRETDKEISEAGLANSSAVKHPENTVILSRDAGIGKSAILGSEMAVSQHFMAWRCGAKLNHMFLYYVLQREKPRFEAIALGSTIKTIGLSFFKKYAVALPPEAEQDRTAEILLEAEGNISRQEEELGKLKSLKSGLMDDLLTGRVPVTPLL